MARAGADIAAGRENPGARDGFLDDIVSSVSDGLNYIKERASGVAERTASNYGNVWNDIKEFTGSGSANLGPSLAYNEDTGQFETPGGPAAERVGFGREDSGSWSDTRSEGGGCRRGTPQRFDARRACNLLGEGSSRRVYVGKSRRICGSGELGQNATWETCDR